MQDDNKQYTDRELVLLHRLAKLEYLQATISTNICFSLRGRWLKKMMQSYRLIIETEFELSALELSREILIGTKGKGSDEGLKVLLI